MRREVNPMRRALAAVIAGVALFLLGPAAFADQVIGGYDVSTPSGCQAFNMYWHNQNLGR
jgi:hypothetical protein